MILTGKLCLYERFGVKEHLIVFPERECAERYVLKAEKYGSPEIFTWDERLTLTLFPMEVILSEILGRNPRNKVALKMNRSDFPRTSFR